MPNQKNNSFFTPHPLSKHYSKPYHRTNQNQVQIQNQNQNQNKLNNSNSNNPITNNKHQLKNSSTSISPSHLNQPKPSHSIKLTQKTSKPSPSIQKFRSKKINHTRNNLNFNDFSLPRLNRAHHHSLSHQTDKHPSPQVDDQPSTKIFDVPTPLIIDHSSTHIDKPPSIQIDARPSTQIDHPDDRSSSLSSLTSDDDPLISDRSHHSPDHQENKSRSTNCHSQFRIHPDNASPTSYDKLSEHSPCRNSPNLLENMDLDHDSPSELGDDVCLEYTDFGHDLGFPVTWSESEYDEDHEREDQSDEFAEFLLMDSSEADQLFGFDQLETIKNSSNYTQMIDGIDRSDDESNDNDSYLGYMVIEEFDPKEVVVHQTDDQYSTNGNYNDEEEDLDHRNMTSPSTSSDDGATTDSLDEDDHSGLVRFGIEADNSSDINSEADLQYEPEDGRFLDLPASSALGSMLRNLDFSVTTSTADSADLVDPRVKDISIGREIKLPVMGTFSVDRKDRINAGRTIIDEKKSPPLSPFTGGKVIRYNRFKKLRQQSCTGDSELSSLACTPKPEESRDLQGLATPSNLGVVEDEFDITTFIRGISSIDEGCSDSEKKNGYEVPTHELDGLSRWRRVPMSAFRRRMMMNAPDGKEENERLRLDSAIQTSSLVETLSLCEQPADLRHREKRPPSKFISSLNNSNKFSDRNDHRRLRKTKSYNSNGKQSKLNYNKSCFNYSSKSQHPEPRNKTIHQNNNSSDPVIDLSTTYFNGTKKQGAENDSEGEKDYEKGNKIQIGLIDIRTTSKEEFETKTFNQVLDVEIAHDYDDNKNSVLNSSFINANNDINYDHLNNFGTTYNRLIDLDYPPVF